MREEAKGREGRSEKKGVKKGGKRKRMEGRSNLESLFIAKSCER